MGRETFVHTEIMSQPECWRRAVEVAAQSHGLLPRDGERVAVVGCGTSWFMAQAYAALRESAAARARQTPSPLPRCLIRQFGARVAVPLVLHGSSGVSDADLTRAVVAGITKVNIAMRLSKAFTAAVRTCLEENPSVVDTRKYLGKAREVVAAEVSRLLQVLGYGRERSPSGGALRTQRSPVVDND